MGCASRSTSSSRRRAIVAAARRHRLLDRRALRRVAARVEDDDNRRADPGPESFSVRWFVSYAELPGIEKLWNQRLLTWLAANMPKSVSASHAKITARRWRETT